ncbi:MAG: SHOCT domain-containing protein [Pseudonocardia sp.]|nr:SHOCT domain-containing protein [Pseudonocardia sp.]
MTTQNGDEATRGLAQLAELRASGALTDDEYRAAEARLREGPGGPSPVPPPPGRPTQTATRGRPMSRIVQVGGWTMPLSVLIAAGVSAAVIATVSVTALVQQPADLRSLALGTWACYDADSDRAVDYVIGDGTYDIPSRRRHGTWTVTGTTLTINETKVYSDGDTFHGTVSAQLTSPEPPTGASISYSSQYGSGFGVRAEGKAHYDGETVTVRLQHRSNSAIAYVTCAKR